jgi:hypothetical protein
VSYAELSAGFDRGTVHMACGAFPGFKMTRIARTPLFEDYVQVRSLKGKVMLA